MALPMSMVLYNGAASNYLSCQFEQGDEFDQILKVQGTDVWNLRSRFQVEPSITHPTMVHIRCSYNNKYLRRRSKDELWIVAGGDKPEENLTEWSSTLFKPEFKDDGEYNKVNGPLQLLHAQLGRYLEFYIGEEFSGYKMCIWAGSKVEPDHLGRFHVTDRGSLVGLPKHVALKSVINYRFVGLLPERLETDGLLQFGIDDPEDRTIHNEVVYVSSDATTFRVKNVSRGAFWRNFTHDYVWADESPDTAPSPGSIFRAISLGNNMIALRDKDNKWYCKRHSDDTVTDVLSVTGDQVSADVFLMVTEFVASRTIADFEFRLGYGRVYNQTENRVVLNPGVTVSNETESTQVQKIGIPYTDVKSSSWTGINTTFKLGPTVTIRPNRIPHITGLSEIELTNPFEPSYEWGRSVSKDVEEVKVYEITVPPLTSVTVRLVGRLGTCDVPFGYTREDVMIDSKEREVHFMEDGVYTGTNYCDLTVELV